MRHAPFLLLVLLGWACNGVGGGDGIITYSTGSSIEIHRLNLGSGEDLVLGQGLAPVRAPDGLYVYTSPTDLVESDERFVQPRVIVEFDTDGEPSNNGFHDPQLSPDGTRVAYVTNDGAAFVAQRADGVIVARLLPEGGITGAYERPTWTPDGRLVLAGGSGNPGLHVTDTALATVTRFDPALDRPGYPAVSPDGGRVVCVVQNRLWLLALDGTGLTELRREDVELRYPTWSPDGSRIAYFAGGRMKLVPAGGGEPIDLFDRFPALKQKLVIFSTGDQFDWD